MRIERYYSSVQEQASPLADDASSLLDAEDYVGFFKACGPNYVRSIRRAQEVTAIFKFNTSSREIAGQFASGLKVAGFGGSGSSKSNSKSKFNAINSSLTIKILGYGMGLTQEGSETMVATSLDEYNEVMKFAFRSMTKNKDAHHIGMVYGMEVAPWVHNTSFQVAAKLQDQDIIIPLPSSLIPRSHKISDPTDTTQFTKNRRNKYTCKDSGFVVDKFGYCCEPDQLYDYASGEYTTEDPTTRICRPNRSLDRSLVKDNMANNGEFVARMDSSMRYRLVQLSVAEKCISAANAIPNRFDFNILKAQDTVKYDRAIDVKMTLFDLKRAVDPLGDFSIIKHLGKELDEWIDQFYSPCMAALYGTNIGTTPDVDVSYFMAYPWHSHEECLHLSCLSPNMRWDRDEGGCIPGLITGGNSPGYSNNKDSKCAKSGEKSGQSDEEKCKYDQNDLKGYHGQVTKCWKGNSVLGTGQIDYFIDHFCMPQLTKTKVSGDTQSKMIATAEKQCGLSGY